MNIIVNYILNAKIPFYPTRLGDWNVSCYSTNIGIKVGLFIWW